MSNIQLPNKKYEIIYADPPWKYKENWGNGACEHSYPTMTNEDIMRLPVGDIVSKNAHLYLWVTNPFLPIGLQVCEAWGFEYKTTITWLKTYKSRKREMGMGYYFRGCTEHILFGVRGKKKILNKTTRNFVQAVNPRKHSQKPKCFRDMIVKCSGDVPRIELFAREKAKGWDVWGNEV